MASQKMWISSNLWTLDIRISTTKKFNMLRKGIISLYLKVHFNLIVYFDFLIKALFFSSWHLESKGSLQGCAWHCQDVSNHNDIRRCRQPHCQTEPCLSLSEFISYLYCTAIFAIQFPGTIILFDCHIICHEISIYIYSILIYSLISYYSVEIYLFGSNYFTLARK